MKAFNIYVEENGHKVVCHHFSRDGCRIVFQSPRANGEDTNIYVINADGSNIVQLTNLKGFAGVPVYSPDEKIIVFQWRESSNWDDDKKWRICTMNADGKNVRRLTNTRATERASFWSPDGKRIAFSSDGDGPSEVYVMNADGSNLVCLTRTSK